MVWSASSHLCTVFRLSGEVVRTLVRTLTALTPPFFFFRSRSAAPAIKPFGRPPVKQNIGYILAWLHAHICVPIKLLFSNYYISESWEIWDPQYPTIDRVKKGLRLLIDLAMFDLVLRPSRTKEFRVVFHTLRYILNFPPPPLSPRGKRNIVWVWASTDLIFHQKKTHSHQLDITKIPITREGRRGLKGGKKEKPMERMCVNFFRSQ